jgi:hypothetical protein
MSGDGDLVRRWFSLAERGRVVGEIRCGEGVVQHLVAVPEAPAAATRPLCRVDRPARRSSSVHDWEIERHSELYPRLPPRGVILPSEQGELPMVSAVDLYCRLRALPVRLELLMSLAACYAAMLILVVDRMPSSCYELTSWC